MNKKDIATKLISVCLALAVWQAAAMLIHQKILLVTPLEVIVRLCTIWQVQGFFASIWFSFYHIALGFLLGLLLGCLLAVAAYRCRYIEILLWPVMATVKSVPVASFVVICLIWLSAANLSVFISFLVVMPIIYQNMLTGLRAQSREMDEFAVVFEMPRLKRLKYITIPQIREYLVSACSVTTGLAWKSGVAAEIIGTPSGSIGKMLYTAKIYLDTDDLLAWTVIIVVISVVSEKIFMRLLKGILGYEDKRTEQVLR